MVIARFAAANRSAREVTVTHEGTASTGYGRDAVSGAAVVWLRQDLRLADNPALHAAAARGGPVIVLFVLEPETHWPRGAASRYWLHRSLAALGEALEHSGNRLILRRGDAAEVLPAVVAETAASALYWNRRYEPDAIARDTALKQRLADCCDVASFRGRLLFEPTAILTRAGTPYRVFTPFHRACLRAGLGADPLPVPRLPPPQTWPRSDALAALGLLPQPDWAAGIRARWCFGEAAARARLDRFIESRLEDYREGRDLPARDAVSGLSAHLAQGEISPRSIVAAVEAARAAGAGARFAAAADAWLRQLVWREFAYHLLFHYPHTPDAPLREAFADLPWVDDAPGLAAWQRGRTGFPLVDAGMRELWATGTMHNRVRMVTASFLCKHLGVDWRHGARWFWDTLVDADLANNTFGWQWSAGCGADAAPYFRIFNPVSQSRRFDPRGDYLRTWIPELAAAPDDDPHRPGAAGYAEPIVDLGMARRAALERYAAIRP